MKKFIFPFLIILVACHENDGDITPAPTPTPPYQFNGVVADQALSWVTPHFTHGTNLTIHRPEAPGTKLSVAHGFYLRNEEKNMLRSTEILTVYSKPLDPEEFDSFFIPGQYEVGKDFFIRLEFNQRCTLKKMKPLAFSKYTK